MCPVNPDSLKIINPFTITEDRKCVDCGYNLVGLRADGLCPECGRPIHVRRKNFPRYTDNLIHAPTMWLAGFAFGSVLLFIAGLGMFLAFVMLAVMPGEVKAYFAGILCFCSALWYISALMLTAPRPMMPMTTVDPRKEWQAARSTARVTQLFWIGGAGFQVWFWNVYRAVRLPPEWLALASLGCFVVAAVGLVGLCWYISNLAFWGDDEVGVNFRTCAWMVGAAAALAALHQFNEITHSVFFGGFWASLILVFLILFMILPELFLIYCLYQLQHMARWSLKNHATADAKTRRLKAQAERSARRGVAQATSIVPREGPIALEADSSVNPANAAPIPAPLGGADDRVIPRKAGPEDPYEVEASGA